MATITLRQTKEKIVNQVEVKQFLQTQGVLYEHWNVEKIPTSFQNKFNLTPEEKEELLALFKSEIEELSARRGYKIWDIVALSESTPNILELVRKFEEIHTHSEDEVRAILSGHGIFIIKGDEATGYFDVNLEPGDVISVPEGNPHFFTLQEDKQVIAVRLFVEMEGWVATPYTDTEYVN
ncbi:acireductone dioxygenase [Bacillus coahuilensis p1.1.43]|uniref:Acireductone dioxygenase n=1 Tax=Bacillus coahuilensis p1.1.43 TaxID=1150625 RepID=A0A147KAT9_9BACI|nr:cupin domain-containing protein [Bacillus coahuilensis]KUP07853.1 acireductone dioxygenase [Bacillus coahuilensis p1.1.43]